MKRKNQNSPLPSMRACRRCHGLLVFSDCWDHERGFPSGRCVNCGHVVDAMLLWNRTHRPPIGWHVDDNDGTRRYHRNLTGQTSHYDARHDTRDALPNGTSDSGGNGMTIPHLSPRQARVLELLWDGRSQKEITVDLGISEASVQTHLVKLRRKFHARSTLQLCRLALVHGILRIESDPYRDEERSEACTSLKGYTMPYLNLDLDYFTHPKVIRLVGSLGEHVAIAPIRLWCYVGKFHCATGVLDDYSVGEIEAILGWKGESGALIDAMIRIRFLDKVKGHYRVHDWLQHAGHLAAFKKRARVSNYKRWKDLEGVNPASRSARMAAARKKGTHTRAQWESLKALFDHTCVRCHNNTMHVEKDHIIPIYRDGSDAIVNIQPVCAKCNASKSGETIDHRLTYLIHTGKAADEKEARCLLERLLNASLMPPPNHLNHPNQLSQPLRKDCVKVSSDKKEGEACPEDVKEKIRKILPEFGNLTEG